MRPVVDLLVLLLIFGVTLPVAAAEADHVRLRMVEVQDEQQAPAASA
jgi:biopolymer transport protein ExbD